MWQESPSSWQNYVLFDHCIIFVFVETMISPSTFERDVYSEAGGLTSGSDLRLITARGFLSFYK